MNKGKENSEGNKKTDNKTTPKPPTDNQKPKPNIPFDYDAFWLAYIKDKTSETLAKLKTKFDNYLTFIDTLSFTTFLGGIGLTTYFTSTNLLVFLLIFSPIIFLQYVKYKLKIEIDTVALKTVGDMRNPIQIHEAHNELVKNTEEKLKKGKPWVKRATILYLLCIPSGIFLHNYNSSLKIEEYCKITLKENTINIVAQIPNSTNHFIEIKGKTSLTKVDTIINIKVSPNEKFQLLTHYHPQLLKVIPKEVSIKYVQDKQLKSYTQRIQANTKKTKN